MQEHSLSRNCPRDHIDTERKSRFAHLLKCRSVPSGSEISYLFLKTPSSPRHDKFDAEPRFATRKTLMGPSNLVVVSLQIVSTAILSSNLSNSTSQLTADDQRLLATTQVTTLPCNYSPPGLP